MLHFFCVYVSLRVIFFLYLAEIRQISFFPSPYSKANYKELMSELEETKKRYQSTSVLLDEKTMAMGQTVEELQSTRAQLLGVQAELKSLQVELEKKCSSLQSAEKRRSELEAEIVKLEEARAPANQEKDKYWSKEEELSEQMMKMEQVLREELEHFENLLQAKDAGVRRSTNHKKVSVCGRCHFHLN